MPTTKTTPKPSTTPPVAPKAETNEAPVDSPDANDTPAENGAAVEGKRPRKPREVRVAYHFADDDIEVLDDLPEQEELPRNTANLVGRTSQYKKHLQRWVEEFPGKWARLATFDNGGAAKVAVDELRGFKTERAEDGTESVVQLDKARDLPEGTEREDWEFEIRRVAVPTPEGGTVRKSQLWVKYNG